METGQDTENRTGVKTRKIFGCQMRFNMADGFPATTTKKLAFNTVKGELIGFIQGLDNAADFRELGVNIWDANANDNEDWLRSGEREGEDDLGRIYGVQWRDWRCPPYKRNGRHIGGTRIWIDQLQNAVEGIIDTVTNPSDPRARRLIVTAWNPAEIGQMALPPCHMFFQYNVRPTQKNPNSKPYLDLLMYQRSCDMFLGVPFNIASYSLLLHMTAQLTGTVAGDFVHILGDSHIYHNHFDQVEELLSREPLPPPKLWLNPNVVPVLPGPDLECALEQFDMEDIKLVDYDHHGTIKAEMAV
jgi:thymidylate synthase